MTLTLCHFVGLLFSLELYENLRKPPEGVSNNPPFSNKKSTTTTTTTEQHPGLVVYPVFFVFM